MLVQTWGKTILLIVVALLLSGCTCANQLETRSGRWQESDLLTALQSRQLPAGFESDDYAYYPTTLPIDLFPAEWQATGLEPVRWISESGQVVFQADQLQQGLWLTMHVEPNWTFGELRPLVAHLVRQIDNNATQAGADRFAGEMLGRRFNGTPQIWKEPTTEPANSSAAANFGTLWTNAPEIFAFMRLEKQAGNWTLDPQMRHVNAGHWQIPLSPSSFRISTSDPIRMDVFVYREGWIEIHSWDQNASSATVRQTLDALRHGLGLSATRATDDTLIAAQHPSCSW